MLSVDEIIQIFRSLMCVFFCGGSCIEDISTHLMCHLSFHLKLKTCSADTILRAIKELTVDKTTYTSPASGKSYDLNSADKMNELLIKSLLAIGGLCSGQEYNLDFNHQFIQTEKFDAKRTYKKFLGYSPGVSVIGDNIVGNAKDFGLSVTSRIKNFVFKYISVSAKWVKTSGTYRLNIYTENFAYARAFNTGYDNP